MSYTLPTSFTKTHLSQEELQSAITFSPSNLAFIQNLIAQTAEEILGLKYDPSSPLYFVQRDAELKGQLGILNYLVFCATNPSSFLNSSSQE